MVGNRLYSIIIAPIFYEIGIWLLINEWHKDPALRNVWGLLSAIAALVMGVEDALVGLVTDFL